MSARTEPEALGADLARAARLRLCVDEPEAVWAVRDAAEAVRSGLRRLGLRAAGSEKLEREPGNELRFTVCAPPALARLADATAAAREGCLVVAGVASAADLAAALPHLHTFRAVASSDPALLALLQAAGVPSCLWSPIWDNELAQPADDPLIAGLPRSARAPLAGEDVWAERPLDVVSLGPEDSIRGEVLGAGAARLAGWSCVLVHRRALWRLPGEPILAEATADHVFRRAKVVLNVHAGEASALDWSLGILDAMVRGAVVVSTPCFPHPFLTAGVHYVEATSDRILHTAGWLLETVEGRHAAEAVRSAAAGALAPEVSSTRMAARLLQCALRACEQDRQR